MRLKDQSQKIAKTKGMLDTVEAAKLLGYSRASLVKWRTAGKGPAYYKGKGGMVFYKRDDLVKFQREVELVRVEPARLNPGRRIAGMPKV